MAGRVKTKVTAPHTGSGEVIPNLEPDTPLVGSLFRRHRRGRPPHADVLTPAEWRVLEGVREGETNPAIAARLGLSANTVKTHISSMLAKLDLRSREELAIWEGSPAAVSKQALSRMRGALIAVGKVTAAAGAAVALVAVVVMFARVDLTSDAPPPSPTVAQGVEGGQDSTNATVTIDGLPVRTAPSAVYLLLGTLPADARVTVVGRVRIELPQPTDWLGLEGLGWVLYDPADIALDGDFLTLPVIDSDDRIRVAAPLHPDTTRTGIDAVDRVIEAVIEMDRDTIASLVQIGEQPCTDASAEFVPWTCPEGVPLETLVSKFNISACGPDLGAAEELPQYVEAFFDPAHLGYRPGDVLAPAPLHLYAVFEAEPDVGGYWLFFAYSPGSIGRSLSVTPEGEISRLGYGCGDPVGSSLPSHRPAVLPPFAPSPLTPPN